MLTAATGRLGGGGDYGAVTPPPSQVGEQT